MPKYVKHKKYKVDVEKDVPPKEMFMPLGWDEDELT